MRRRSLLPLLAAGGLAGCDGFLFYPERGLRREPDQLGLDWHDLSLDVADGVRLHGWLLPAKGEPRGTVVFFHGNAENISTHVAAIAWLPAAGFSVILYDYRGYGLSTGKADLAGVHADATAILAQAPALAGVDPARMVVFGQSLGGAVATVALARSPDRARYRGLVLEAAPAYWRGLAREKLDAVWLTWLFQAPLSWTISDDWRPVDVIAEISPASVLLIQGEADTVVPPDHARELFIAAREPKDLWLLPDVRHNGAMALPAVRERLLAWLIQVTR